jgi:hypothetical protein
MTKLWAYVAWGIEDSYRLYTLRKMDAKWFFGSAHRIAIFSLTLQKLQIFVSSRTSDSCGGPGTVHANQGCTVFPPKHWCGWLPGWMCAVLRSSAAWLGCVSEDARLSTFISAEPVREL